jgi:hypothetical protein
LHLQGKTGDGLKALAALPPAPKNTSTSPPPKKTCSPKNKHWSKPRGNGELSGMSKSALVVTFPLTLGRR